jgi:hypothetical protein
MKRDKGTKRKIKRGGGGSSMVETVLGAACSNLSSSLFKV